VWKGKKVYACVRHGHPETVLIKKKKNMEAGVVRMTQGEC
jgi:hypothetical protein